MYSVLKQECVLGSVMLSNTGPLRDQHIFVMVKFLCVRFSIFYSVVFQEIQCHISLNDCMYISLECILSQTRVGFGMI